MTGPRAAMSAARPAPHLGGRGLIERATFSLSRVAVDWSGSADCPRGPRFLRRISARVSRVAGEDICLGYSVERRSASLGEAVRDLRLQDKPTLEIRRYASGFTSVRVRLVGGPRMEAEDLVRAWRSAARSIELLVNEELREQGMLSRPYALVNVIEGDPLEDLPAELLYSMSAPLMKGEVSRRFAESRSKRDWGIRPGDFYFLTPMGLTFQLGRSGRAGKGARKRMRAYLELAIDVALAQEVAFTNPSATMGGDGLLRALIHLSPDLWRSGLLIRERPLMASYSRVAEVLKIDDHYKSLLMRLRSLLTSEQMRALVKAKSLAYRLGLPLGVAEPIRLVGDDCFAVIDLLALKHAVDSMGLDPERGVEVLSLLLPWKVQEEAIRWVKRSVGSREDHRGLAATELARLIPSISQSKLYSLLGGECPPGWLLQRSVPRRGAGRRRVVIYEVNTSVDLIRALVAGWSSSVSRVIG